MATTSTPVAGRHSGAAPLPRPVGRAGFIGSLRSEFTKIRSTRSTHWTLLALVVITVGFGALASAGAAHNVHQLGPGFDPTQRSLFGLYFGQLVIAVLGALTITSEYGTGMIRTSLTAMPRRGTVFAAKAVVFAAVALVIGLITSFGAFFLGQALMSGAHINATLSQPHVLRAVVGGALFLAACGMLAYGLGAILRHTAGAITASIVLLFVVSLLINALPQSWQVHVDKWVPAIAGSQIWAVKSGGGNPPMFGPWSGFAVFCGYAAIALIAGLVLFRKRDA
jgi:ABC-type transport system involved in multi-copper enzyme maturation permease subunit